MLSDWSRGGDTVMRKYSNQHTVSEHEFLEILWVGDFL